MELGGTLFPERPQLRVPSVALGYLGSKAGLRTIAGILGISFRAAGWTFLWARSSVVEHSKVTYVPGLLPINPAVQRELLSYRSRVSREY